MGASCIFYCDLQVSQQRQQLLYLVYLIFHFGNFPFRLLHDFCIIKGLKGRIYLAHVKARVGFN